MILISFHLADNASPEEMDTLMQECENLIKIGPHPNIIEVYGISIINGQCGICLYAFIFKLCICKIEFKAWISFWNIQVRWV